MVLRDVKQFLNTVNNWSVEMFHYIFFFMSVLQNLLKTSYTVIHSAKATATIKEFWADDLLLPDLHHKRQIL